MGWFSDALFGERKRMDPNKINDMMSKYDSMVDEQEKFARDAMDPNSQRNRQLQNQVRQQSFDMASAQNQGLMSAAAMGNVSQGQLAMQMQSNMSTARNQLGSQMQGLLNSQFNTGMSMFGESMASRRDQGERQANMYMQQVNAANERRQQNVGIVTGLIEAGLGAAGTAMSSDIALKENIKLVDKSPSGINIYEFDYKDKSYGKGRYKGVIAQEVPNASFLNKDGYLWVDYSKLDVNCERIS
tara:strand:- start:1592 stop:2320 length:729 start_codon:yes stop_codon:yes gene_type:complete